MVPRPVLACDFCIVCIFLSAYFGYSSSSGSIMSMKLSLYDLWQVVSNESGVLAAIKPGKSFVDMSSVEVYAAMELYEVSYKSLHFRVFSMI